MDQTLRAYALTAGIVSLGLLTSSPASSVSGQTFVTPRGEAQNVRFEQREDGVVHILYDLISSDPRAVFSVKLEASHDGGTTFAMQPQNTTGDTGAGVTPGPSKRILWDSGKDVERVLIDRFRFRIVATAGPLQVEAPVSRPESEGPAATPTVPAANAKGGGGGKAKWLIPLVAGGGVAAGVAAKGGGGSATTTPTSSAPPTPPVIPATQCRYTVSPITFTLAPAGGGTQTVSVSTTSGCAWTATSNATFIAISGPASFVGNDTVTFTTQSNTSTTTRTGTLSVAGESVTVTQIPPRVALVTITVDPNPVPYSGTPIIDSANCGGVRDTWSYNLRIIESAGVAVTVNRAVDIFNSRPTNDSPQNHRINGNSSLTLVYRWCQTAPAPHSVVSTLSGVDANGNSFSATAPTVTLLPRATGNAAFEMFLSPSATIVGGGPRP